MPTSLAAVTLALLLAIAAIGVPRMADAAISTIVLDGATSAEGIATGEGTTFYAGDLNGGAFDPSQADADAAGDIYRGDYATGETELFIDAPSGRFAVGLDVDTANRLLFVAGGPSGNAFVYSTLDGSEVATVEIGQGFVNDVIVVDGGAWFTNSVAPTLTFVPVTDGAVGAPEALDLSGPAADTSGDFNLNGIESLDADTLIVAHSTLGAVITVDTATGESTQIALDATVDGDALVGADGILLTSDGELAVVENQANRVVTYQLSADATTGTLDEIITDEAFTVPTTVAEVAPDQLAVVNAQFGVTDDTEFEVVVVERGTGNGLVTSSRIAGDSRFETAVAISQYQFPDGATEVYLARADDTVDAVAGGSLTAGPVLLVPSCGDVPQVVLDEVSRLGVDSVIVLGGEGAVCQDVLDAAVVAASAS